jgi:DNA excision repair protein ERCC-4
MCSNQRSCDQLNEYFAKLDPKAPKGKQGQRMMRRRFQNYIRWKARLNDTDKKRTDKNDTFGNKSAAVDVADANMSEAMKRKDAARQLRAANRRRVRGGAPSGATSSPLAGPSQAVRHGLDAGVTGALSGAGEMLDESDSLAVLWVAPNPQL